MPNTKSSTIAAGLPNAVLYGIFKILLDNTPVVIPSRPIQSIHATLSLVCKRWKSVISSSPAFWVNILFMASFDNSLGATISSTILQQLEIYAPKSQNSRLTIVFDRRSQIWTFDLFNDIMKTCGMRVMNLTAPIFRNGDIKRFLLIPAGFLCALEHIDICLVNSGVRNINRLSSQQCSKSTVFHNLPSLRSVVFHHIEGVHPNCLCAPWNQLTSIDMGGTAIPPDIFFSIMHTASRFLQEAFFYIRFSPVIPYSTPLWPTTVVMSQLNTLRLRLMYPSADTRFFSAICFPSLEYLWISMYDTSQDWNIHQYTKLLRPSGNSLRRLRFTDFVPAPGLSPRHGLRQTSYQELEELFTVIPNVSRLSLPLSIEVHSVTVDKLASCLLLPALSMLELTHRNGRHILSMVRKRGEYLRARELGLGSSRSNVSVSTNLHTVALWIPDQACTMEELCQISEDRRNLGLSGAQCRVIIQLVDDFGRPEKAQN